MKKIAFAMIGLILIIGVGCSKNDGKNSEATDIKALVHDYSVGSITNETASITSHELIVTKSNGSQKTYDLPKDDFFVSIAPFIKETHPCAIHSLTGCQGELANKEFDIYIEDSEGNVVVDKTMKSFDNGFIDLWVPRDNTYNIKIEYDGKVVQSTFSSFENDNTCITTMQLGEV